MKRDSIQTYRTPFTVEEMMEELKFVLWCNASQIALSGLHDVANTYLGFEAEFGPNDDGRPYAAQISLERFTITYTLQKAYDFAFQVGNRGAFTEDDWMDLAAFKDGAARADWEGLCSPFRSPDSKLSHVADMALARMDLMHGNALTIRSLCLLANMTESAVRSALSTEGIKTEGRPASLPADTAAAWLSGRRGYVPTADSQADGYKDKEAVDRPFLDLPLAEGMAFLMNESGLDLGDLAKIAHVDIGCLGQFVQGKHVAFDVSTLIRIAIPLGIDPQVFLSRITQHVLLGLQSSQK